jgi:glucose-1-phosphate adenylyltransferase
MRILAFLLAGGCGQRLLPLTLDCPKPALPFAGGYRVIDFALANLVHSGVAPIYVLVQYKPRLLVEHIRAAWTAESRGREGEVRILQPPGEGPADAYAGTADAVRRHLDLVARHRPDLVAVFAADHVYRMDVRQMADAHCERNADVTIAAAPVPVAQACGFGVLALRTDGRVVEFQEKPARAVAIPTDPTRALASMGNYLFRPEALVALLGDAARRGETDFGRHVLPRAISQCRVTAYDFARNVVPGTRPFEEPGYWRDIGTIEAFSNAQRDVLGPFPRFRLFNPEWPPCARPDAARLPDSLQGIAARQAEPARANQQA